MLMGSGGNIGVTVGDDGVVLIDDEFAPLTEKIKAAIAKLSPKPIRFLLNTHWHGDHTGGNENIGKMGVVIVAQDNVRNRMSVDQFNAFFNRKTPASPAIALPIVTFASSVTLHQNGDDLHFFHVDSAHTDGDAVVHFVKSNVIHTGDVFFSQAYPFIDLSSGGSIDGYINGVKQILVLADDQTKIIPGHGELSDKKGLQNFYDMLKNVRETVAAQIKAGKSLDQINASKPSKAYDDQWGKGFVAPDIFVGVIYHSLTGK